MDKAVVVLVGEWDVSPGGSWYFVLEKRCMAQCILVEETITYEDLKKLIEREFAPDMAGVIGRIAYLAPTEMSVFSSGSSPPVSISSDAGVQTFLAVRKGTRGLNMFVTFVIPPLAETDGGGGSRWRVDGDSISLNGQTPEFANEAINAEAHVGDGGHDGNVEVDLNSMLDEDFLAEVERLETRAEESLKVSHRDGKQKVCFDENWKPGDDESEDYEPYGTDEEEDYNYSFWDSLITREYGRGEGVNANEVGETSNGVRMSSVPETQEDAQVRRITAEEPSRGEVLNGAENNDRAGNDVRGGVLEENEAVTLDVANRSNEIEAGDILQSQDCPPCFGDEIVPTQHLQYGQYDQGNDAIFIGRVFRNKQDMRTALGVYAVKRFFNFKQLKSDKERLIVVCIDRKCPWRVYGHVLGGSSENMQVRTATLTHTCDVSTRSEYGKKASCRVIAEVLRSKYANGQVGPRAVEVPALVLEEMRVSVSYMRAWHAKERAVAEARGTADGSYQLLLAYLYRLKQTNGGTIAVVEKSCGGKASNIKFKYLFFSLGACINAMKYMRKVVIIDATSIKSKFRGCLLTASCQDGNFQVVPIGFGVVNSENEPAWSWFLRQLKEIIPDEPDLVIVSDRHASINKAIRAVYPQAAHGACAVHLYRNIKAKFRRARVEYLFTQAATAYTVGEFREKFDELERRSPACALYLRDIGIAHWSRAYSAGKRYNLSSSNVAESLNAAVAKALEYPIVTMVETIRLMLMRWFYERRVQAEKQRSPITKEVEEILMTNLENSGGLVVAPASEKVYQVSTGVGDSFTVDLERRTCSCRRFDTLGFPCCHGIAAARQNGTPVTELVDVFYTTEYWRKAYSGVVMPVPDEADVDVPEPLVTSKLLPPDTKQAAGRPRKRRIPSVGENLVTKRGKRGQNRCSRCFQSGHNRATCDKGIP